MSALVTLQYEGSPFLFRDDGWFNATLAAKKYGKRPARWLDLDETKEYISALDTIANDGQNGIWVKTRRGNNGGSWLHPKLAVRYAQWLDARFAVWCDMQIDAILRHEILVTADDNEISTVRDRTPLLLAAVHALHRHGTSLPSTYRGFNKAAGSKRFQLMTLGQVRAVTPIAKRIVDKSDTHADWAALAIPDGTQNRLTGF